MTRWLPRAAHGGLALLALPGMAHAHGSVQGMNAFYGGLLHPLLTLPHVLVLLGLGLWLGQHRPLRLRTPLLAFALALAAALSCTPWAPVMAASEQATMAVALVVGVLLALAVRSATVTGDCIVAMAGFALGWDSGVDPGPSTVWIATSFAATWLSLVVLLANVAYYSSLRPTAKWADIAVRIAGSWIAAASLLVLAFALKN